MIHSLEFTTENEIQVSLVIRGFAFLRFRLSADQKTRNNKGNITVSL
jgi:hypothetical protein